LRSAVRSRPVLYSRSYRKRSTLPMPRLDTKTMRAAGRITSATCTSGLATASRIMTAVPRLAQYTVADRIPNSMVVLLMIAETYRSPAQELCGSEHAFTSPVHHRPRTTAMPMLAKSSAGARGLHQFMEYIVPIVRDNIPSLSVTAISSRPDQPEQCVSGIGALSGSGADHRRALPARITYSQSGASPPSSPPGTPHPARVVQTYHRTRSFSPAANAPFENRCSAIQSWVGPVPEKRNGIA